MQIGTRPYGLLFILPLSALFATWAATAAVVTWTHPGDGLWDDPGNWSTGTLPGPDDDVLVESPATPTITHTAGDTRILSLTLTGSLHLGGGSIRVTATSSIAGALTVESGAALVAEGPRADLTLSGDVRIGGGSLIARDGARIALPGTTHQAGSGLIRAQGAGSRIQMDGLTNIGVPPADIPDLTEAISREASVYRGRLDDADPLVDLTDAVSREASVRREEPEAPP